MSGDAPATDDAPRDSRWVVSTDVLGTRGRGNQKKRN